MTGCASDPLDQSLQDSHRKENEALASQISRHRQLILSAYEKKQDVDQPWLAGNSVPLPKEVRLPKIMMTRFNLRANQAEVLGEMSVTLVTPECNPKEFTLKRFSLCITALVGVPVYVRPDALLPISQFTTRRSGGAAASPAPASGKADLLSVVPVDITLNRLLELANATWDVRHRLQEDGSIEIYRLETRILRLKALAQKNPASVRVSSGFNQESVVSVDSTSTDALADMKQSLMSLGTMAGSVEINPNTKAALVTDTPESIARMEAFIEQENKRLTRRISMVIDQIFVTNETKRELSVDWQLIATRLGRQIRLNGPGTQATDIAARSTLVTTPGGGSPATAGSQIVLQALAEQGFTVTRRSFPISALNGSTVSIGLPTIFDYVQSVQSNTVSTAAGGTFSAPTIVQREDRFGVFLNCTLEAQDSGEILAQISLSDRSGTLSPYKVSVAGSENTIQQRHINEATMINRTVLRTGMTQLVGGLEEAARDSTERRIGQDASIVFGGSDTKNQTGRRIILLVTAFAEDGI
ncbi:MAG: hypothetical protein QM527_08005 [Alphaproteobacteria bacterium]|nr:hypothetical protein [Alphaproteobacteria bacterium]